MTSLLNATAPPVPFCIGLHASLVNGTCICSPGYGPEGLCIADIYYYDTAEYNGFVSFFLCAATMLFFVSIYEICYALFKRTSRFRSSISHESSLSDKA